VEQGVEPRAAGLSRLSEGLAKLLAVEPRLAEEHGVLAAIKDAGEDGTLEGEEAEHAVLDGAFGDEVDDLDGVVLADAVDAADALFQDGGVPGRSRWMTAEAAGRLRPVPPESLESRTRWAGS